MVGDKRTKWFYKIRDSYFARSAILSVQKTRKLSRGKFDGIDRGWVITLSLDVCKPPHNVIWASDEEIGPLLAMLEEETYKEKLR